MNEKLNTQDIIDLLASKDKVSRKDATVFIRELFQLIEDGLETDQIVKIKGLGTFKLIRVESRESINVNTGERFIIEGHNKISFTPDAALKEQINKPFAHFETVILNDGVDVSTIASEQFSVSPDDDPETEVTETVVEEEVEEPLLSEENKDEPVESVQEETDPVKKEEIITPADEITIPADADTESDKLVSEKIDKPSDTEQGEDELLDEIEEQIIEPGAVITEPAEVYTETNISSEPAEKSGSGTKKKKVVVKIKTRKPVELKSAPAVVAAAPKKAANKKKEDQKKTGYFYTYLIATILTVIFLCGITIFFLYNPDLFGARKAGSRAVTIEDTIHTDENLSGTDSVANAIPVPSQPDKPMVKPRKADKITSTTNPANKRGNRTISDEDRRILRDNTPVRPDYHNYEIVGHKTDYRVKAGETLTRVSLRFYGTKDLWPYIYKYNQSVLSTPERVSAGMKLRIPELRRKDVGEQQYQSQPQSEPNQRIEYEIILCD